MDTLLALSQGLIGEPNPEQRQIASKIISQSLELTSMINEILQVGSLQAGKVQSFCENTDLNALFDTVRSTSEMLPRRAIDLRWEIPADMPTMNTDAGKLRHILQNLIHNALKFTECRSVTITAQRLQDSLVVRVADTGIGMDKELLPLIFDMFRQVDSSKSRSHGGVGLGLFIVAKFVDLLKGKVEVESTPGGGTTFTVTIPSDDQTESSGASLPEPESAVNA